MPSADYWRSYPVTASTRHLTARVERLEAALKGCLELLDTVLSEDEVEPFFQDIWKKARAALGDAKGEKDGP